MADDDKKDDASEDAASGGGKKSLIMMIVIGLVLVGASVGGTITVLKMTQPPPAPEVAEGGAAEPVEPVKLPAIYYPLEPSYILNIDARGRRRFLKLDLTVLTREDDVIAAIELHRATVDHKINLIAGGQVFEEVQTAEGKEFLRLKLLEELQTLFEKEIGKPGIEQVLFTNFVMQ